MTPSGNLYALIRNRSTTSTSAVAASGDRVGAAHLKEEAMVEIRKIITTPKYTTAGQTAKAT